MIFSLDVVYNITRSTIVVTSQGGFTGQPLENTPNPGKTMSYFDIINFEKTMSVILKLFRRHGFQCKFT